jgi:hypothetical protein
VVAEAHHNNKVQAQEYFDKIFRILPDITDLPSLRYIFHNVVTYLTILIDVTPANLEKVESLGTTCSKRAQAMGNELVLAQVNLSLSMLITHLVSISYYTSQGPGDSEGMVRSMSVTNLSHFQQIQQRKLQLDAASTKPADGVENASGTGKTKYVNVRRVSLKVTQRFAHKTEFPKKIPFRLEEKNRITNRSLYVCAPLSIFTFFFFLVFNLNFLELWWIVKNMCKRPLLGFEKLVMFTLNVTP